MARGNRFCHTFCEILAWPLVFWLAQRAKNSDTNHIPRATAYRAMQQNFTLPNFPVRTRLAQTATEGDRGF